MTARAPQSEPDLDGGIRPLGWRFLVALLATVLLAASLGGGVVSAGIQAEECVADGPTLNQAKANYAATCTEPRVDCDLLDTTWYCSDHVIGNAAPGNSEAPPSTLEISATVDPVVPPEDVVNDGPDPTPATEEACTATAGTLQMAKVAYEENCTTPRVDCDPVDGEWTCSGEVIGAAAPGTAEPATPAVPTTTTVAPTTTTTEAPAPTTTTEAPAPTTTTTTTTEAPTNPAGTHPMAQRPFAKYAKRSVMAPVLRTVRSTTTSSAETGHPTTRAMRTTALAGSISAGKDAATSVQNGTYRSSTSDRPVRRIAN